MLRVYLIADEDRMTRTQLRETIVSLEPDAVIHEASSARMLCISLEHMQLNVLITDPEIQKVAGLISPRLMVNPGFALVVLCDAKQDRTERFSRDSLHCLPKPPQKKELALILEQIVSANPGKYGNQGSPSPSYYESELIVTNLFGSIVIRLQDVIYLKADNSYTVIFTSGGEKIASSKPIYHFGKTLHTEWFYRIHKSHIINIHYLKSYLSADKVVVMQDETRLKVSRYTLPDFVTRLELTGS